MNSIFIRRSLGAIALLTAVLAFPARADVSLRVEGRPQSEPIQAFVRVTDQGAPVTGLTDGDFTVTIDGVEMPLSDVTQPPSEDPTQHVSVVFAMDYTSSVLDIAQDDMESSVIEFINAMNPGDMAAIVKFNDSTGAAVVAAFTQIDGFGNPNNEALEAAVLADYPGDGSNILDAVNLAVEQFESAAATLPAGPKAVVLVTDGIDTHSTSTSDAVIVAANDNSLPIFAIGVGDPNQNALDLMNELADDTGGAFFLAPTGQDILNAYASIAALLNGEYLITIPDTSITDCEEHELEVTVNGQSAIATFTRRACDTTPDSFTFASRTDVQPGRNVTSETVTITGVEIGVPVPIRVNAGRYSIGCTDTFTNDPGTISDGETVCVRHTAAADFSTSKTTTLTIGGLAGTFTSTTREESGGGGGGGGATGLLELLLGLGLLLGRRRLVAR